MDALRKKLKKTPKEPKGEENETKEEEMSDDGKKESKLWVNVQSTLVDKWKSVLEILRFWYLNVLLISWECGNKYRTLLGKS